MYKLKGFLPKKLRESHIKACEVLIERYENRTGIGRACPLCQSVIAYGSSLSESNQNLVETFFYHDWCSFCPWVLLEKKTCGEANFRVRTYAYRIKRLKRWVEVLQDPAPIKVMFPEE